MEQKQRVTSLARDLEHLSIEERGELRGVVVRQRPSPEEVFLSHSLYLNVIRV